MLIQPRIFVASVLGLAMVGGAFYWSQKAEVPQSEGSATIVKNSGFERSLIPVYDSDNNSVPDWQDVFAFATIELEASSSTEKYVPNTRTGELALELARTALRANTNSNSPFNQQQIINETINSLNVEMSIEPYTPEDILISSDNSTEAQKQYGNRVAEIILENAMTGEVRDELTVLNEALQNNDPTILEELEPRITSYQGMIDDMLKTTVPSSLVPEHLQLLDAYQALLADNQYLNDATALYTSIVNLYEKLNRAGIQWNESDMASQLITVE